MAINQTTLSAAETYTDDQVNAHEIAANPHPQYARLVGVDGQPTGGRFFFLNPGDSLPAVERGSVVLSQGGVFIPNEAVTAWVKVGNGPLPADTTPPTAPTSLRTTAKTTTSITVAWNASTDTETGVSGYDVAIDGGAWVPVGDVLTYTFSGLTASATPAAHAMQVRARDNATTPNVSTTAVLSDTTTAATVPQPQNLRVTATTTSTLTFAWDAPASGTVSRYEWSFDGSAYASNGTAATKQVTGLSADTPHNFSVRAVFTDGNTSAPVTLSARTQAAVGGGTGSNTLVGLHVTVPTTTEVADNPELWPYRTTTGGSGGTVFTQLQSLQKWETDMNALTGFTDNPLMTVGHIFHGPNSGYVMKSWGTQQLTRQGALIASFKPTGGASAAGLQRVIAGTDDAAIKALIASLPVGKRIYLGLHHEPDNDLTNAEITYWRQAQARWARLIIDNRGTKDIHPFICLMTWTFRTGNEATLAQWLQVTQDFEAAGIDWRTQVVNAPDGYEDDPSAVPSAFTTFANVFPQLKAAGWQRFGITETACPSKAGTLGSKTTTAADVTAAPGWAKSVMKLAQTYNMEYVCWFNTTGNKGPVGSWQITNAVKDVWGRAAHLKGPDPSW